MNWRPRRLLALSAALMAAASVGCAHCDTCDDFPGRLLKGWNAKQCDDFPAPCTGPNCGYPYQQMMAGGPAGVPMTGAPVMGAPMVVGAPSLAPADANALSVTPTAPGINAAPTPPTNPTATAPAATTPALEDASPPPAQTPPPGEPTSPLNNALEGRPNAELPPIPPGG